MARATLSGDPGHSFFARQVRWVLALPGRALIGVVRLYQVALGPLLGGRCRFYPSCSNYFIEAVRKHGACRGAAKGIWRILRCQPFCDGGYDPP